MNTILERLAGEFTCHRTLALETPRRCLGASCMAWEWENLPEGRGPNMATWQGHCGYKGEDQCKR